MSTIRSIYTKGLKTEINRYGVWEPGNKISLGDFGTIKNSEFQKLGNIKEKFNINFSKEQGRDCCEIKTISHKCNRTITPTLGIKSSQQNVMSGDITLSFVEKGAFYIDSLGNRINCIKDIMSVKMAIKHLYKNKCWDSSWYVVTELEIADSAHIIIAGSNQSRIEFNVRSNIDLASINLASANIGLKATVEDEIGYRKTMNTSCTLSFNAIKLSLIETIKYKVRTQRHIDSGTETRMLEFKTTNNLETEKKIIFEELSTKDFDDNIE